MGTASLYYVDDAAVWIIKSAVSLELLGYSIVFGSFAIYVIIAFTNRHGSPVLITFFIPLQVLFVAVLYVFSQPNNVLGHSSIFTH
jgi:hypothetical protein